MLTVVPESFCSSNYRVFGSSCERAIVAFDFFTEQGYISLGNVAFTIRKQGAFSGRWTLNDGSLQVGDAAKPNPFFRSVEIVVHQARFSLSAQSPWSRCFAISVGRRLIGEIRPVHLFTRRAIIDCSPELPELGQLFAFWLVAMLWRRDANNST